MQNTLYFIKLYSFSLVNSLVSTFAFLCIIQGEMYFAEEKKNALDIRLCVMQRFHSVPFNSNTSDQVQTKVQNDPRIDVTA